MPQSDHSISLRAATPGDQEFLLQLFAASREDLALAILDHDQKQLLIEMQFRARANQYGLAYPDAITSIIVQGDKDIGSTIVNRGEHNIHLVDIALLPEWREHGIGTSVLRTLFEEATLAAKTVRLDVAVTNRAIRLYERLGFARIKDGGAYISMEWRPRSNSNSELAGHAAERGRNDPANAAI